MNNGIGYMTKHLKTQHKGQANEVDQKRMKRKREMRTSEEREMEKKTNSEQRSKKRKRRTPEENKMRRTAALEKQKQKRRADRKMREENAVSETLGNYYLDKPFFRNRDELMDLCRSEMLTMGRKQEILDEFKTAMGRRTPVCVCATCGEICFLDEGDLMMLADKWFDEFKVSQTEYDAYRVVCMNQFVCISSLSYKCDYK